MKRFLLTLVGLLIAFVAYYNFSTLTMGNVKTAFEQEGLTLKEGKLHPNNVFQLELNNQKPSIYELDGRTLTIYVFPSVLGRVMGEKDFENKTATASVVEHRRYAVKNVLIFYVPNADKDSTVEAKIQKAIAKL